jgi:hypothetical protein
MGFAIFTVFKAGFVFSARGGSGVVIAKLPDGSMYPLSVDPFLVLIVSCRLVGSKCDRHGRPGSRWTGGCRDDRFSHCIEFSFGEPHFV